MPPSSKYLVFTQVLTANREKIDQEAMKERNALYWPISALRVLLKAKNNPEVRIARPKKNLIRIFLYLEDWIGRMSALPF